METVQIYSGKKIEIKSEQQFRNFMYFWQNIARMQQQKEKQEKQSNGN